jgi:transcriptional regulator with XRE-family HTH domain
VANDKESDDKQGAATEMETLGQRLRSAREYLGLSQELVAERLGIPRASVSAIENGKRKVSSLEVNRLAKLYKVPVTQILSGEPEGIEAIPDESFRALFRATRDLGDKDREQVLRFAQFLRAAGRAPKPDEDAR